MKMTVQDLIGRSAALAGGSGLSREVKSPQISAPDLSIASSRRYAAGSVVHLLPSQFVYLSSLSKQTRLKTARALMKRGPACIVVSGGPVCRELLDAAEAAGVPVFKSGNVPRLSRLLVSRLATRASLHGVLVQIFGIGTLILGESAVGKSEAALDLVLRGHKLAADDVVLLERSDDVISGRATDLGAGLLQIRGLGIIDIRALYGETATAGSCEIGLVVELEEWRRGHQYSLIGLRERRYRVLGMNLPYLKLPVKPGRNMATLIEVAARNQMLKSKGVYTARELNRTLTARLTT